MAVTTGTTWDVILSARPVAPEPGSTDLSVRATYQEVLYERAVLVDLREDSERRRGVVHPDLAAVPVRPQELVTWLVNDPPARPVVLLSEDGDLARHASETLAELGLARPRYAVGGFRAWLQAGLPARTARLRV
ncbi:rhodanese-like domain-containing protein [Ruania halotolerans]|uniref:rhodanese-like domain-containing protein n=1 Tax=Ruania halotolerans TaxID=2897773 RepID=UPI001E65617B|nr:rhodanese-like domain-containing protein [Ruania halotolerans]UFU05302.1 rhodanese-like domain-containing protein [Ruania halotolerans]